MKRSRFTEEEIIGILKEQEAGAKTADVCRKYGISLLGSGSKSRPDHTDHCAPSDSNKPYRCPPMLYG